MFLSSSHGALPFLGSLHLIVTISHVGSIVYMVLSLVLVRSDVILLSGTLAQFVNMLPSSIMVPSISVLQSSVDESLDNRNAFIIYGSINIAGTFGTVVSIG